DGEDDRDGTLRPQEELAGRAGLAVLDLDEVRDDAVDDEELDEQLQVAVSSRHRTLPLPRRQGEPAASAARGQGDLRRGRVPPRRPSSRQATAAPPTT